MSDTNGTPKRLSRARRKLKSLQLKRELAEARIQLARAERRAKLEELRAHHAWPREMRNPGNEVLLEALKGRNRQKEEQLLEAKRTGKDLQEGNFLWDWVSGYQDLIDRLRAPDGLLLTAISIAADRMYGSYWPFFRTWNDLALLRGASRIVYQTSCLARGAVNGVASYIVGDGFKYKAVDKTYDAPPGLCAAVQDILDENSKRNNWPAKEKSCVIRDSRDGEWYLRDFPLPTGYTAWRWIEPEQLIQPGDSALKAWSFGIENPTDPYDVETKLAFHFCANGNNSDGEVVAAEHVIDHQANVDSTVKRGIPALAYDTYDFLKVASRLIEHMTEGAAIQASIAYVRQWESPVTGDQATDFVSADADYTETNPWTGGTTNTRQARPGTIEDIPKGMGYANPPGSPSAGAWVEISQAALSAVAITWNAPKWLLSNDTDLNYASSLTAESPFVKTGSHEQCTTYKPRWTEAKWREIRNWCEAKGGVRGLGRLYTLDEIKRYVDIQCEPPSLEVRNKADEAQANATRVQGGWKSRATVATEEGLDWEQERANLEQERDEMMPALPMPGQNEEGGGNGNSPFEHRLLEGQWITLSAKDKDGQKHGSVHVYLDGGKIVKGPPELAGKELGHILRTHKITAQGMKAKPAEKPPTAQKTGKPVAPTPAEKPKKKPTPNPDADTSVTFTRATDRDAAIRSAQKTHGEWAKKLTENQRKALKWYQQEGYADINGSLRRGMPDPDSAPYVAKLDAAIASAPPLPHHAVMYRGVKGQIVEQLQPGATFEDKGFVSTTINRHYAGMFAESAGDAIVELRVPAGTKAAAMDAVFGKAGDRTFTENEYLLPRGSKYKVVDRRPSDSGATVITAELVPS